MSTLLSMLKGILVIVLALMVFGYLAEQGITLADYLPDIHLGVNE